MRHIRNTTRSGPVSPICRCFGAIDRQDSSHRLDGSEAAVPLPQRMEVTMTRTFSTLACAGLVAAATMAAAPAPAEAYYRGGAVAAGAVMGLAAGAMIGAAAANAAPTYYYPAPPPRRVYYYEPVEAPVCYMTKRRVWVEGYGWTVRRMEVCE
jgi:hypothetical protein